MAFAAPEVSTVDTPYTQTLRVVLLMCRGAVWWAPNSVLYRLTLTWR
jgi:hypothetical protein